MKAFWNGKIIAVLLIFVLLLSCVACTGEGETVIITCNGLSITESTFMLLMTEQAIALAEQEGITEENLVEKAKEATLNYLPTYTYFVQSCKSAGYTLTEDDKGALRANTLTALLNEGFTYDSKNRDALFLQTFGATFEQYMDFQEQSYLISYFYQEELKKQKISEELTKAYFKENQSEYAICTVDVLRYPKLAGNEMENTIAFVTQTLKEHGSLEDCKAYTGWDKAETITFDISSNLNDVFGDGFVEFMVAAQQGEVVTRETDTFITVARLTSLSGYTENLDIMEKTLREEQYVQWLEETVGTQQYVPEIVNQEVYDAIREIPGSTMV